MLVVNTGRILPLVNDSSRVSCKGVGSRRRTTFNSKTGGSHATSQPCDPNVPTAGIGCVSFTNDVCSRDVPRVFCVDGYWGCPAGTIEVEMCACGSNPYRFNGSPNGSTNGPGDEDGG
jgi:hypothetical protein